jgi:hypothetical protein
VLKLAVIVPPVEITVAGLPTLLPSMMNWTAPVGAPAPGAITLIVAVKVTFWPDTDGLTAELTAMAVAALVTV